jgi:hypothetical protein
MGLSIKPDKHLTSRLQDETLGAGSQRGSGVTCRQKALPTRIRTDKLDALARPCRTGWSALGAFEPPATTSVAVARNDTRPLQMLMLQLASALRRSTHRHPLPATGRFRQLDLRLFSPEEARRESRLTARAVRSLAASQAMLVS